MNGLTECPPDCAAMGRTEFGHRGCRLIDSIEELSGLPGMVARIDRTLFDTLGSEKTGNALDGLAALENLPGHVADLAEAVDTLEVR